MCFLFSDSSDDNGLDEEEDGDDDEEDDYDNQNLMKDSEEVCISRLIYSVLLMFFFSFH